MSEQFLITKMSESSSESSELSPGSTTYSMISTESTELESSSSTGESPSNEKPTKVLIMSHAERVTTAFPGIFLHERYHRFDLNLPDLPLRHNFPTSFNYDSPITVIGQCQAKICSEAIASANETFEYAFSSPSLGCIQTCDVVLNTLGIRDKVQIKIEPGLMDYLRPYATGVPDFMTNDELVTAGYNIDTAYEPNLSLAELQNHSNESDRRYYRRKREALQRILQIVEPTGGRVLLVGHPSTLDACTREIVGKEPRMHDQIRTVSSGVKHCSTICLQKEKQQWKLRPGPMSRLSHLRNDPYNYRCLL